MQENRPRLPAVPGLPLRKHSRDRSPRLALPVPARPIHRDQNLGTGFRKRHFIWGVPPCTQRLLGRTFSDRQEDARPRHNAVRGRADRSHPPAENDARKAGWPRANARRQPATGGWDDRLSRASPEGKKNRGQCNGRSGEGQRFWFGRRQQLAAQHIGQFYGRLTRSATVRRPTPTGCQSECADVLPRRLDC